MDPTSKCKCENKQNQTTQGTDNNEKRQSSVSTKTSQVLPNQIHQEHGPKRQSQSEKCSPRQQQDPKSAADKESSSGPQKLSQQPKGSTGQAPETSPNSSRFAPIHPQPVQRQSPCHSVISIRPVPEVLQRHPLPMSQKPLAQAMQCPQRQASQKSLGEKQPPERLPCSSQQPRYPPECKPNASLSPAPEKDDSTKSAAPRIPETHLDIQQKPLLRVEPCPARNYPPQCPTPTWPPPNRKPAGQPSSHPAPHQESQCVDRKGNANLYDIDPCSRFSQNGAPAAQRDRPATVKYDPDFDLDRGSPNILQKRVVPAGPYRRSVPAECTSRQDPPLNATKAPRESLNTAEKYDAAASPRHASDPQKKPPQNQNDHTPNVTMSSVSLCNTTDVCAALRSSPSRSAFVLPDQNDSTPNVKDACLNRSNELEKSDAAVSSSHPPAIAESFSSEKDNSNPKVAKSRSGIKSFFERKLRSSEKLKGKSKASCKQEKGLNGISGTKSPLYSHSEEKSQPTLTSTGDLVTETKPEGKGALTVNQPSEAIESKTLYSSKQPSEQTLQATPYDPDEYGRRDYKRNKGDRLSKTSSHDTNPAAWEKGTTGSTLSAGVGSGIRAGTSTSSHPGTTAGADPRTSAGAYSGTSDGADPGTSAGADPGTSAGADPGTSAGADPGTSAEAGADPADNDRTSLSMLVGPSVKNITSFPLTPLSSLCSFIGPPSVCHWFKKKSDDTETQTRPSRSAQSKHTKLSDDTNYPQRTAPIRHCTTTSIRQAFFSTPYRLAVLTVEAIAEKTETG